MPSKLSPYIQEMIHLYKTRDWSLTKLADRYDVCPEAIRYQLKKHNVKRNPQSVTLGPTGRKSRWS